MLQFTHSLRQKTQFVGKLWSGGVVKLLGVLWYILSSFWVLRTSNAGQNMLFRIFGMKNIKRTKRRKHEAQSVFFGLAPQS